MAVAITDESHCLHFYLLVKINTDELRMSFLIGHQRLLLTIIPLICEKKNLPEMWIMSEIYRHTSHTYLQAFINTQFDISVILCF